MPKFKFQTKSETKNVKILLLCHSCEGRNPAFSIVPVSLTDANLDSRLHGNDKMDQTGKIQFP